MAEITERRCPKCKAWNSGGLTHCSACNELIEPTAVLAESERRRVARNQERPKAAMERFLESIQNSRHPLVRMTYLVLNFFWLIYMGILAFFIWIIAWLPG